MALLAILCIPGCGFQLRGSASLPPDMARTYIETGDRHSLFYRALKRGLKNAGIEVVDQSEDAGALFAIRGEDSGQRVLSVSARNVPREYEVYYTIVYDVRTDDGTILVERDQTLTRDYIWDETLVLGKEKEAQLLREAIVDDLVRVILIQLSAI